MIRSNAGFTTVEVLVTLFIAVTLLAGGYQAYSSVVASSKAGREQGIASNIAYENLRREAVASTVNCVATPSTDLSSRIPSASTLPTPRAMTRTVTCPFGATSPISLVTVTVSYGATNERVSHAMYAR